MERRRGGQSREGVISGMPLTESRRSGRRSHQPAGAPSIGPAHLRIRVPNCESVDLLSQCLNSLSFFSLHGHTNQSACSRLAAETKREREWGLWPPDYNIIQWLAEPVAKMAPGAAEWQRRPRPGTPCAAKTDATAVNEAAIAVASLVFWTAHSCTISRALEPDNAVAYPATSASSPTVSPGASHGVWPMSVCSAITSSAEHFPTSPATAASSLARPVLTRNSKLGHTSSYTTSRLKC